MTRTDNSLRNMKYAFLGQVVNLLLVFVTRRFFVSILGDEYNGLHGFLASIIGMLALAELGIGASIFYSLYKPIAENNQPKINALMKLFRKAYTIIGFVVAGIGIILLPFLPYLLRNFEGMEYIHTNIYVIFGLFLLNSASGYFFVYKQSLLTATQNDYINTNVRTFGMVILNVLQIAFLYITRNYLSYLIIQIIVNTSMNVILSRKADQMFPFIKEPSTEKLTREDVDELKRNVKANTMHSLGGFLVFGTDNILIGMISGLAAVAHFNNYNIVLNGLATIFGVVFSSLTASVGNLGASTGKETIQENFNVVNFLGFWIFGFSVTCLYILFNPFMTLWMGPYRLLSRPIVIMIIVNFYLKGMRRSTITYKDSLGLFWYDRWKPMVEAVINLGVSIFLGMHFGLFGILLGTAISTLTTCFWIEPFVLYRYGFKSPLRDYFKRYGIYTLSALGVLLVTRMLVSLVTFEGVFGFILLSIATIGLSNGLLALLFHRTREFQELLRIVKSKVLRRAA
ncbi:MAG: hypothetical protein FWF59_11110 [Turicibacter sp.]|nr:hypothetical protein [Turicibacter sp.]